MLLTFFIKSIVCGGDRYIHRERSDFVLYGYINII